MAADLGWSLPSQQQADLDLPSRSSVLSGKLLKGLVRKTYLRGRDRDQNLTCPRSVAHDPCERALRKRLVSFQASKFFDRSIEILEAPGLPELLPGDQVSACAAALRRPGDVHRPSDSVQSFPARASHLAVRLRRDRGGVELSLWPRPGSSTNAPGPPDGPGAAVPKLRGQRDRVVSLPPSGSPPTRLSW